MKKAVSIISLILFVSLSLFASAPVIGISGYSSDNNSVVKLAYIESVRLAGGVPIVLPVTTDDAQIDAMLSVVDALVMTGGEDFDPLKWYGEEPRTTMTTVNAERDEFDVKLLRAAVAKGIPVLGICRGEQALGVAFGGALWQDIPSDVHSEIKHNQSPTDAVYATHSITIEKGSNLASLLGSERAVVNSFHHQSIKRVPAGLKAVAFAADGIVEAVERDGKITGYEDGGAWIMGTQFHPERLISPRDTTFLPIFKALVREASR